MNKTPENKSVCIQGFYPVVIFCLLFTGVKSQDSKSMYNSLNMKTMEKVTYETESIIKQFNKAFSLHDPSLLVDLVAENCMMESIQGPDGIRYEGYDANLTFWQNLVQDKNTRFDVEEVFVAGDRATIRWRYFWGEGLTNSVRGVTLVRVRNGKIEEALAYSKTMPSTGLDN